MLNGMTRCLSESASPGDACERASRYLMQLGYRIEPGAPTWLALMADKGRRKGWPDALTARRIMAHVYRTAGWPPRLMP
jgi:hypothetical protein